MAQRDDRETVFRDRLNWRDIVKTRTPAILGGSPAFSSPLRLVRPTLPPVASIQDGLAEAFSTGTLTKGPALRAYEDRLAAHLGVRHAIGVASCTLGTVDVLAITAT
jgi:hypothetical protein